MGRAPDDDLAKTNVKNTVQYCSQFFERLQEGDTEASHGELQQEVNYGSRARSCYKQGTLIL